MDEDNVQRRLLKVPKPEKVIEEEDELEDDEYDIDIGQINYGKVRIECTDEKGLPVCKLCGKNFPSFQSLFGHMMCHPEREWRGIGPPDHDHELDQLSTTDDLNMIDEGDVSSRKRSWRSQVGINSQEEDVADNFEATSSNSLTSKNDFGVKLRSFDEEASDESRLKKMKSMTDLKLGLNDSSTSTSQAHENPAVEGTSTIQPDNKYKCNICNKNFPTHQALGGHKSSHNKFKINMVNAVADKKDDGGDNGTNKNNIKLGENVKGTSSGGTHQCTICNKVFPTGQALGGHMRRHGTGPPADRASPPSNQVISSPEEVRQMAVERPMRVLNLFDLNEVPQMEDEGGR